LAGAQAVSRPWIEPVTGESELRRSVSEATARIEEIIDTAERVAEGIRAEAEAEARRRLAEREREVDRMAEERARELGELAGLLTERARYVFEQVQGLAQALERTAASIRASGAPAASEGETLEGGAGERSPDERHDTGEAQPQPRRPASPPQRGGPDEPLLRAIQMAVAGSERAEIESTLHRDFGVEEPGAIVDQILGRLGR
jgi:hypothetical protein